MASGVLRSFLLRDRVRVVVSSLLWDPVHAASLGAFRACFGVVVSLQALAVLAPGQSESWITRRLTGADVTWRIPFTGLEWVKPWPEPWMTAEAWLLVAAGAFLAVGLFSRVAAAVAFLAWTHVWTCDATQFNNHYYLISLFALLLVFMPAERSLALSRVVARLRGREPSPPIIPAWPVTVLRAQLLIVYFYGGVAKLDTDYLFRAEPLRSFLADARLEGSLATMLPHALLGPLVAALHRPATAFVLAWLGLAFDLGIGVLLVIRRTRFLAIGLVLAFHAINHFVIFADIGVFPLLGFTATLVFLDHDWPLRLARWLKRPRWRSPDWRWALPGAVVIPGVGLLLGWEPRREREHRASAWRAKAGVTAAVVAWIAVQALVPLRPVLIAGNAAWTTEGTLFSWRMKTTTRRLDEHGIILRHAGMGRLDAASFLAEVERPWDLTSPVYRHVPAERVDWRALPHLLVVRSDLAGEVIYVNPHGGGGAEPISIEEAGAALLSRWQGAYGRVPSLAPTSSLGESIQVLLALSRSSGGTQGELSALERLRTIADRFSVGGLSEDELLTLSVRANQLMKALLPSPRLGSAIPVIIRHLHPFALDGAVAPPGPFLVVEDDALVPAAVHASIDRQLLRRTWDEGSLVHADFRRLHDETWPVLGRELLLLESDGTLSAWWNVRVDLTNPTRRLWALAMPVLFRHYAHRIARLHADACGVVPEVHAFVYASVNRGLPRALVDPAANVAAEQPRFLSHAPWILGREPARPSPDAPVTY